MTIDFPADVRFLARRPIFEAPSEVTEGAVALFGVPYDSTTSFRPGTRFGPEAVRAVADGLEYYSPEQDRDLEDISFCDLGELDIPFGSPVPVMARVRGAVGALLDAGARPLMIGGEHSLTAPAVEATAARHPDLLVIQFDAHADLRPEYLGERYSHASAMARCLEAIQPGSMAQVGIRSGTRDEFVEMRGTGRLLEPRAEALAAWLADKGQRPIYLTVDLDVFDPASLPGTGTPEPGGIDWPTFAALLAVIPPGRLVAADVMELSPQLDASGCSSVLAAKVVREILLHP